MKINQKCHVSWTVLSDVQICANHIHILPEPKRRLQESAVIGLIWGESLQSGLVLCRPAVKP